MLRLCLPLRGVHSASEHELLTLGSELAEDLRWKNIAIEGRQLELLFATAAAPLE